MTTEAGKRLLDEVNATGEPWRRHMAETVAAIEAEAIAADRRALLMGRAWAIVDKQGAELLALTRDIARRAGTGGGRGDGGRPPETLGRPPRRPRQGKGGNR
jgi:hypothetical protein